ncbi:MAG TPA: Crp/Fnr family transcriptional regulator [Polyangiales bacterium]
MAGPNVTQLLGQLPLFQASSEEQKARVAAVTQTMRVGKGVVLFHKGDPMRGMFVVVYGQIKLSVQSESGQEKVVELIGPGQSFGEAMMFLNRPYPVTAQALDDSMLLDIPKTSIDAMLDGDPLFARRMLAGMSMRLHSLIRDVEGYSLRSSAQRVVGYLLVLCHDREAGAAELMLPASKQVIASRLNLTPETLSRILGELTRLNLVTVKGRDIEVHDVARLRAYGD